MSVDSIDCRYVVQFERPTLCSQPPRQGEAFRSRILVSSPMSLFQNRADAGMGLIKYLVSRLSRVQPHFRGT